MSELLQILGAVLVLAGFAASQFGWLDPRSVPYLVANVAGAGLLAVIAYAGRDWGFLLLEGVWTAVSLVSLAQILAAGRRKSASHRGAARRGYAGR